MSEGVDLHAFVDAGPTADLSEGEVHVVELPSEGRRKRHALIVLAADGRPRAYLNECQHLPIPLDSGSGEYLDDEGRFFCKTHGAVFRVDDGFCLQGPCDGRSLEPLRIKQSDGHIEVARWERLPGRETIPD